MVAINFFGEFFGLIFACGFHRFCLHAWQLTLNSNVVSQLATQTQGPALEQIRKYYDQFARQYSEKRSDGLALNPLPYLKFFPRYAPGTHLVDLGCGPGFESELACEYGLIVTGVDISPKMIELFNERNSTASALIADLKSTGVLANSFDVFLSSFSLLHCSDQELSDRLKEMARINKPNAEGLILVGSVASRLEVSQIHREAKDISGIQPIPFYFRSVEDWQKAFEGAGFVVTDVDLYPVTSTPLSVTAFFVKKKLSRRLSCDVELSTSWRDSDLASALTTAEPLKQFAGVARLSRLEGLTDFHIPIYQASRPLSKVEVTVCGGKGMTSEESRASALFESIEIACAENRLPSVTDSPRALSQLGTLADLNALGIFDHNFEQPIEWTPMREFLSDRQFLVPSCLVGMNNARTPVRANSHGLASGLSFGEALLHGFLELIERHNFSLSLVYKRATSVAIELSPDLQIQALMNEARRAGLTFEVKDTSWPTGIPSHFALLYDMHERDTHLIGGGLGCHVDPKISIIRAMLEALQSRAVTIAGGREDLERQARLRGDRFEMIQKTYEFWYQPTAERIQVGKPLFERLNQDLQEVVGQLYAKARAEDDALGRLLYYVLPSPDGTAVCRTVLEGAELFGLYSHRPGPRIKAILDSADS